MNGISRDAWIGFVGVVLGSVVSLIGVWIEGQREARRTAQQRRYERVKDRVDKVEPHIARLNLASYEVTDAAANVLWWTLMWWQSPDSERPLITQVVTQHLGGLERATEKAQAVREEDPGIILDSLEPEIIDGLGKLHESLGRLMWLGRQLLFERDRVLASHDVEYIETWTEEWRGKILAEHEIFKGMYKTLTNAVGNLLELGYQSPSLVERLRERLREWWGRRKQKGTNTA